MSNDPQELRRQIADTRGSISNDVNALADAANPKNIAERQVDKIKDGGRDLKEKIFGSPYDRRDDGMIGDARDAVAGQVDGARQQVAGAADQARYAAQQAPVQVKQATRGNPLAAGLIAFGFGALLGGLLPATQAEAKVAQNVKEQAQPLVDQVQQQAQGLAQDLKGPATDAMNELKDHAQQSVDTVKGVAAEAKDDVMDAAADAKDGVAAQAKDSAQNVKDA